MFKASRILAYSPPSSSSVTTLASNIISFRHSDTTVPRSLVSLCPKLRTTRHAYTCQQLMQTYPCILEQKFHQVQISKPRNTYFFVCIAGVNKPSDQVNFFFFFISCPAAAAEYMALKHTLTFKGGSLPSSPTSYIRRLSTKCVSIRESKDFLAFSASRPLSRTYAI